MLETYNLKIGNHDSAATGGATFEDLSPVTGESMATIAAASPADGVKAVAAASEAQRGWAQFPIHKRRAILLRAADILDQEREKLREVFALETGATFTWADMNVTEAATTLREAAALVTTSYGTLLPSHDPSTVNLSERTPAGVVLAIVPWNAPLILAARSIAIALAVGNAVVIRPSELAPITGGYLIANVLHRAGMPDGVVNVVSSAPGGGRALIETIIAEQAVRRVVFIGSTPVGRSIASFAAKHLTPSVMELGGKNATIVLDDADIDSLATTLAFASFANSGQVCMCSDRILVYRSRAEELAELVAAAAQEMTVGDPRDSAVALGPLINAAGAENFSSLVTDAVDRGAKILSGKATTDGLYAKPTVLTDVPQLAALNTHESFSPLVAIHAIDSDDEAIALANDTEYGLIGSVLSPNRYRAESIARQLKVGAVHVNGPSVGDEPHVPFGGLGASGFGRLGGLESVHTFTEQRTYYLHGWR